MSTIRRRAAGGAGAAVVTAAMVAAIASFTAPKTAPFEGFVACAYVDKIGRGHPLTIGYGHTGPDVRPGRCITRQRALELLAQDEQKAARIAASCSPQYVVDNKYLWGAATDFALNTGYYCKTSIAQLFAAGRPAEACQFYNRYVYAAGKVQNGLVRRRRFFVTDCMKGASSGRDDEAIRPIDAAPARDGYVFQRKEFTRLDLVIHVHEYATRAELRQEYVREFPAWRADNLLAFSTWATEGACEIHVLDPATAYEPDVIGHELSHCLHGRFHPHQESRR